MHDSIKDRLGAFFRPVQSVAGLASLSLLVAIPAMLIVRGLEPDMVLPAFSLLLFSGAALAVLLAFSARASRNLKDLTLWDVAGGLVMTGCAASVLSEPDQVTLLFEHLFERRSATQKE